MLKNEYKGNHSVLHPLLSRTLAKVGWATLAGLLLFACAVSPWQGPKLTETRDQLTLEHLKGSQTRPLLDMSFFARPVWASNATEGFSGRLFFKDSAMNYPKDKEAYEGEDTFPAFEMQFLSQGQVLIPINQGRIHPKKSQSMWDVMLGVGKVWHETSDGNWNRASFPLSLTDWFIGQVRNCVATFAYRSEEISNVYLQCSQETADADDGRIGNLRAVLKAEYSPESIENATDIISQFQTAQQNRLKVLPLSSIDLNNRVAEYFEKSLKTNASTSLGAVMIKDTVYLHPPKTRHGLYPYPEAMRHGVYSVTKSLAGALALFYFAKKYDSAIFDALISDYVPELASHPGWQGVTFSQTLNMVSGTEGGEGPDQLMNTIIVTKSAKEGLDKVAQLGDAPAKPGETFNYASTNLFVLSNALQHYVSQKEGQNSSYWEWIERDVLIPIGAENFKVLHTQEKDGTTPIPYLAYGATPTLDEAAKIAALINSEGRFQGKQLLNKTRVREALGRTQWKGHSTLNDWRGERYRHGFWASTIQTPKCQVPVTSMLGFGGNTVLFLPNDVVVFRFMDEFDFDIADLLSRVADITPLCTP